MGDIFCFLTKLENLITMRLLNPSFPRPALASKATKRSRSR